MVHVGGTCGDTCGGTCGTCGGTCGGTGTLIRCRSPINEVRIYIFVNRDAETRMRISALESIQFITTAISGRSYHKFDHTEIAAADRYSHDLTKNMNS